MVEVLYITDNLYIISFSGSAVRYCYWSCLFKRHAQCSKIDIMLNMFSRFEAVYPVPTKM